LDERVSERRQASVELLRGRFEEWLAARNYSPKTRVNYARDVRVFLEWTAENASARTIAEVTGSDLQRYQMALYAEERDGKRPGGGPLSVGTQAGRLAAVRTFFAWLLSEQLIAHNPASAIQMPRQGRRLPRGVLTKEEARRLLDATPVGKPRDIRDRAILEVLYATAIRRGELIALSIYDLELGAGRLRIEHGKGDATRVVPLTESALSALRLYLDEARPVFAREAAQTRLFVSSRSGGPLDDADLPRIVAKAAKRAGLSKHVTPHTLRHSCATHLLAGRADIRQIQTLLGHRRLSSTEVYTHVEVGDLAEVIARCHPRAKPRE
jgi:integrase/recombinase XerD